MKVVDAKPLLYAVDERSPRHQAAHAWLTEQLTGDETVAFAWIALLAFLAELNSCDTDFARFAGLRWVNPLDAEQA